MLTATGVGWSVWTVARKRFGVGGGLLVTAGTLVAYVALKELLRSRNPEAAERIERLV